MTNQLQGEILFEGWSGGVGDDNWVVTPWMPVRGNNAVFGVQVTFDGGATLTWDVQTRTLDNPTTSSILGSTQTGTSSVLNAAGTPAKELVRYKFSTGGSASTDFVVFRALAPSWQRDR